MNRRDALVAALSAPWATLATQAFAADGRYPQRPISLIVPSAPGGSTDFTARLVAEPLARALGQAVVVDNRAGGSGNIGNLLAARARPDGYTLLVAYSGYQVGNPHLFKKTGWDPLRDFEPVAMLTRAPQVIAARASLPVASVQQLIAYAKANPGTLNYASSGNGSIQQIAAEQFKQITGTRITHVPYRGAGPAVQDLLAGNVDLFITTPASVMAQIQAGKLKGLAVTSPKRLPALPDVPTAAEAGLKGFELDSWFALYAPAGTPTAIIQLLNEQVGRVLQSPQVRKMAEDAGTSIETMTPQQLGSYTRSELDRWGTIIKAAGITLE